MDLSLPITYNGHTASGATVTATGAPLVGTVIERVDVSDIDVDEYLAKRALQDGLDAGDSYLGGRRVNIEAAIYGSTVAHGWDQLQGFLRAYSPRIAFDADSANRGFLAFDFSQPTISTAAWSAGTIPLRFYLRPMRPPRYTVERQATGGVSAKGMKFRASASLMARDPRKYLQSTVSQSITTASAAISYRGDFSSFPTITIGVTTGGSGKTLTIFIDSQTYILGFSGFASGTLTFDLGAQTIVDANGTNSLFTLGTFPGTYAPVKAGSTVHYSVGGGTVLSSISLAYREAWA